MNCKIVSTPRIDLRCVQATSTPGVGHTFNVMEGDSPCFPTLLELSKYLLALDNKALIPHTSYVNRKPYLYVIKHRVATTSVDTDAGVRLQTGEIISSEEFMIYSILDMTWTSVIDHA